MTHYDLNEKTRKKIRSNIFKLIKHTRQLWIWGQPNEELGDPDTSEKERLNLAIIYLHWAMGEGDRDSSDDMDLINAATMIVAALEKRIMERYREVPAHA